MEAFSTDHIPAKHYDLEATVKQLGSPETAELISSMLKKDLPDLQQAILSAHEQGDLAALQAAAHKLHGGLCYVICPKLKYLTHHLEAACKHQQQNKVDEILEHLKTSALELADSL